MKPQKLSPIRSRSTLTSRVLAQSLKKPGRTWRKLWRNDRVLTIALLIVFADALLAPCVWAASGRALSFSASLWVVLLMITTVGLSLYLFYVMLKPEAF